VEALQAFGGVAKNRTEAWRLAKEPDPPSAKIELPDLPTAEDQLLPKPAAVPYLPPVRYKLQHQIARGSQDINGLARNPAYPFFSLSALRLS
jgi:hypothetical protein